MARCRNCRWRVECLRYSAVSGGCSPRMRRWSDPRHPSGCPASIIPPNRDTWRLRLLRRDRTGTYRDQRCVDLGSVKHAVSRRGPVVLHPSPLSREMRRTPRLRGADWDRGHAQSGEGMLARTAQSVDAERVRDREEGWRQPGELAALRSSALGQGRGGVEHRPRLFCTLIWLDPKIRHFAAAVEKMRSCGQGRSRRRA